MIEMVEGWLNESKIEELDGEGRPHLDTAFNILVYRFQCWVAKTLKPAKGKNQIAADTEPIRKYINVAMSDLGDFDKLLRDGDISLWRRKAENLEEEIGDRLSKSNRSANAVASNRYEGFVSLKDWLFGWINGTNVNDESNNLDYCDERLGIFGDGLQGWNRTRGMSLIAYEGETARSCPEFSGLELPIIDGLRKDAEGWRADYSEGKKILIEIGIDLSKLYSEETYYAITSFHSHKNVKDQTNFLWGTLWYSFTSKVFYHPDSGPGRIDGGKVELRDEKFFSNVNRTKMKEPVVLLTRYAEVFNYYIFTDAPL
jgi:hypothetical protein